MKCYTLKEYASIHSTNDCIKRLAAKNAPEWTVILAKRQTKGRGRRERRWASQKGGLYFSVLLYPKHVEHLQVLTFAAALAVLKAIRKHCPVSPCIKWPNDILINHRKVCGILTETTLGERVSCIVGIGLNANQTKFPKEIRGTATSLLRETGKKFGVRVLASSILKNFHQLYLSFEGGNHKKILDEWRQQCITLGKNVFISSTGGTFSGKAAGVTDEGMLRVKLPSGKIRIVAEGDASIR